MSSELSRVLSIRRLATEGSGGERRFSVRAASVPIHSSTEILRSGGVQADGWAMFANRQPRAVSRPAEQPSLQPQSMRFGGKRVVENQEDASTSVSETSEGADQEQSSGEVQQTEAAHFWNMTSPRRTESTFSEVSSSRWLTTPRAPMTPLPTPYEDVASSLTAAESKNAELERQIEALKANAVEDTTRLEAAERQNAALLEELEEYKRSKGQLTEHEQQREEQASQPQADHCALEHANAELQAEKKTLVDELGRLRESQKATGVFVEMNEGHGAEASSESNLRSVLTKPGATVDELRNAIEAVEALVGEARRELANSQLRDRRASYERLHEALEKADDALLEAALVEARRAEVDAQDIEMAEDKLSQLRSMSDEERAAKAAEELKAKLKPELFLYVKKGNKDALEACLSELKRETRWQDWRDFNGRTLLAYARELRVTAVEEVISRYAAENQTTRAEADATKLPVVAAESKLNPVSVPGIKLIRNLIEQDEAKLASSSTPTTSTPPSGKGLPSREDLNLSTASPAPTEWGNLTTSPNAVRPPSYGSTPGDATVTPRTARDSFASTAGGEYDEEKTAAFRATAKDDIQMLGQVLDNVPIDIWREWENKAGKDLLTLSLERGSTSAYALLAKALGLIQERRREAFIEREDVWVLTAGEVLARRATVLEDTSEEPDEVLLEFWDGEQPAERVDRCCVLKAG